MRTKIILRYIFGFLFFLSFLFLVIVVIVKSTIFNSNYLLNELEKNNYYEDIYLDINERMQDYVIPSGFPKEIVNDIFTKEEMIIDINEYINSFIKGKPKRISKENIGIKLQENIDNYLKENNIDVVNKKDIDDFIHDTVNIYIDGIILYDMINSLSNGYAKINSLINYGLIILIVSTLVLIIVNLLLKRSYILSSIVAVGISLLFLRLVIYEELDVINILIISKEFSNVLQAVIHKIGSLLLINGIIFIVIGLLLSLIVILCQSKKNKV